MTYARTRNRDAGTQYDTQTRTNQNGLVSTRQDIISSGSEIIEDFVTPGFRKRIAQGEIINNPCTYSKVSYEVLGSSIMRFDNIMNPDDWNLYDGGCETARRASHSLPSAQLRDIEAECKVRAIAQMDKTPYAFGEDIGEIRETINFIRNPLKSMHDLSKTIRDTARKNAVTNATDYAVALAGAWSAGRFALLPLLRSILDAIEAFNENVTTDKRDLSTRLSARGFSSDEDHYSDTDEQQVGSFYYTSNRTRFVNVSGHAVILYEVTNPAAAWRFNLGLRNKDIPVTLWQLFPLSFMVDRLLDISTAIQASVNILDPSLVIRAGSYTLKEDKVETYHTNEVDASPVYTGSIDGGQEIISSFTYDRNVWKPSPSDVHVAFDKGGLVEDAIKTTDLIAIIINLLK